MDIIGVMFSLKGLGKLDVPSLSYFKDSGEVWTPDLTKLLRSEWSSERIFKD